MQWIIWLVGGLFLMSLLEGTHSSVGLLVMAAGAGWLFFRQHRAVQALQVRIERLERAALAAEPTPVAALSRLPEPQAAPAPLAEDQALWPDEGDTAVPATPLNASTRPPAPPPPPAGHATARDSLSTHLPEPDFDESSPVVTTSLGRSAIAWFKGGNTIVRIAVLLLFIGVAFLLRFAAENALLPIELRISAVALGGLALAVVGWRLREQRRSYGLSLQGAGIGIVYLTLFAAFKLYQLVPAGLTFTLLAGLASVSALLAVRQNAMPLALLGFGGGFLAPVLASTGSGSHVALFSYYLVLNLAIAWIAHRQTWKPLNAMAFLMTFAIGGLWGAYAYSNAEFWTTEPFLVLHFLLFLFISVRYTRQLVALEDAGSQPLPTVDGGLLFGVPVAAFGLQAAMLQGQPLALAASAAVLAGIYLLVGRWLWRASGHRMLLLVEGLLALGVIFLLLVTPLALDAQWTGVAWAIQGAGIVWLSLRQKRWWAAGIGLLMQLAASFSFWVLSGGTHVVIDGDGGGTPFLNSRFVSALVLSLAALATGLMARRHLPMLAKPKRKDDGWVADLWLVEWVLLALGLAQLLAATWPELRSAIGLAQEPAAMALLLAGLGALGWWSARPLDWPALQGGARVMLALAAVSTVLASLEVAVSPEQAWTHYAGRGNALVVLVTVGLAGRLLRAARPAAWSSEWLLLAWVAMWHGGVFAHATVAWGVARHEGWAAAAAVAVPTSMALWLLQRTRHNAGPLTAAHAAAFRRFLHLPWLALLALWVLGANLLCDGSMQPLPYLPLLNPTDLMHGLAALYALRLTLSAHPGAVPSKWLAAASLLGFVWLNGLLVRSLHHWLGTPMWIDGALDADVVQTGLTMLWTACAFITMVVGTRRRERRLWMAGAGLLAVVVGKLFLVDLSQVGTLARIVSFIGVGVLMLVIGYLSPLPPQRAVPANREAP